MAIIASLTGLRGEGELQTLWELLLWENNPVHVNTVLEPSRFLLKALDLDQQWHLVVEKGDIRLFVSV